MDTQTKNAIKIYKEMNDNDVVKFMDLIVSHQTDEVQVLLENGVNPNLTNKAGHTALLHAIVAESPEMVELLIKFGANVEAKIKEGCTLLIVASSNNCVEISELLLKNGASTEETDGNDMNTLMCAAQCGYLKMVQLLIRYGAKIEAIGLDGKTALIFAASNGHVEVVKLLILSGANVQQLSKVRKKSVIMYAARAGKTEVVDLLIQADADIKLKDSDNLTALDHAVNNKHTPTAYRLLSAYSLAEQDEFAMIAPENFYLADDFDKELYNNQEKIYLILRTPYKLKVDSERECHFSIFPLEIINLIKLQEAKLQNFPDWYQHRVERDVHLGFNLMTLAYDAQKKKTFDEAKPKNQSNSNAEIDVNHLNHAILNLKLN